jgi:hypothetical protein
MEHFIINQKKISTIKNKEFVFKIPVLVDVKHCYFIIEIKTPEAEAVELSFNLKSVRGGEENKKVQIKTGVFNKIKEITLSEQGIKVDHLLISCTANADVLIEFSINSRET